MEVARQQVAPLEEPPAQHQGEASAILSMIERAARDPSIDLDRMERLLTMREAMLRREAEVAFNAAMAAAQAEMPRVLRDAENKHSKSRYARLETIAKAITPVITRNGFSLSFDTGVPARAGDIRIVCTVAHAQGHARVHQADLPPDTAGAQGNANKTAVQGFGSTASYGRRYLTLMIFNVALTNEDDDGNGGRDAGPVVTDDQADELRRLIDEKSMRIGKFLAAFDIPSVADLPAARFAEAKRRLQNFVRQGDA